MSVNTLLIFLLIAVHCDSVRTKDTIRDLQFSTDQSCTNYMGWGDNYTDGCGWYSHHDACGASFMDEMGVRAVDACCYCGGGNQGSQAARIPPLLPGDCVDLPNWLDMDNDGCEWYSNDETGCDDFGSILATSDGLTADVACCACGGGIRAVADTSV